MRFKQRYLLHPTKVRLIDMISIEGPSSSVMVWMQEAGIFSLNVSNGSFM